MRGDVAIRAAGGPFERLLQAEGGIGREQRSMPSRPVSTENAAPTRPGPDASAAAGSRATRVAIRSRAAGSPSGVAGRPSRREVVPDASGAHRLLALDGRDRPDEHGRGRARWSADDVQAGVHAVDTVHVGVARAARTSPRCGRSGRRGRARRDRPGPGRPRSRRSVRPAGSAGRRRGRASVPMSARAASSAGPERRERSKTVRLCGSGGQAAKVGRDERAEERVRSPGMSTSR